LPPKHKKKANFLKKETGRRRKFLPG
jgi:hypothetical protein